MIQILKIWQNELFADCYFSFENVKFLLQAVEIDEAVEKNFDVVFVVIFDVVVVDTGLVGVIVVFKAL